MQKTEIIFKPKYNGSMRFALILSPAWIGLALYFLYRAVVLQSFNPDGFLALVFGAMAISLPFRVYREIRFGKEIVAKRYLLPDIVIQ
jgi:hypothetical protein